MSVIKKIVEGIYNQIGWHTQRKLIVFLSDDWGGIRIESNECRNSLEQKGFNMSANRFNRFDILESDDDLAGLYKVFRKFSDHKGNHPVFTAMTNVANPDFEKIRDDGFQNYHHERFTQTLARYPNHSNVFDLYKEGIADNIFVPQFHGREHLNMKRWMRALQENNPETRTAFDLHFFQLDGKDLPTNYSKGFGAAYDIDSVADINFHREIIIDGLAIFNALFDYEATVFTAPAMTYNPAIENTLRDSGIKMIDVPRIESIPLGNGAARKRFNYIGKRNSLNQRYITRTAVFEPNIKTDSNNVAECLSGIQTAFSSRKPAIISNHRAAFTGGLDISNRENGLGALEQLFGQILLKWPDAEFVSAAELYKIMNSDQVN